MKVLPLLAAGALALLSACATKTGYIAEGETAQTVAGFSQDDIDAALNVAVQSVLSQDRIKVPQGSQRAVVIIKDIKNDTTSRGTNAGALAEALALGLRENLTNSGKVIVYNVEAAQYAKVKVTPQYSLTGRLTQRNLRQDNGDIQIEYSLNLQLIDLATGLEFWQKRIPIRKLADRRNAM